MGVLTESAGLLGSAQVAISQSTVYERVVVVVSLMIAWSVLSHLMQVFALRGVDAPIVGKPSGFVLPIWRARMKYIFRGVQMIHEGYEKYKDTIFQIPTVNQNLLVLPTKYVEELKSLPETTMSSSQAVADYFLGTYTTMKINLFGHVVWDITRGHLTQTLGNHIEPLVDETMFGFNQELPDCDDWTPVTVHPTFLQIVGRTSARIFVGMPLCRNPLWLETSIDFARCVFIGSSYLKVVPVLIRPLVGLFSPHVLRIWKHHWNARKVLLPEIRRRRRAAAEDPNYKKPNDMLQWLEDESHGEDSRPERMIDRQLGMSFAAIHTTTNHLTNVIYDLAARWEEYGPELRAEVEQVLGETGGVWKKTSLTKLSKMDSFAKESQRINPPSALSFNRKLQQTYTIPSSSPPQTLPKGSYIAVAAGPISASEEVHSSPKTFDGFRFHRMRQEPGSSPHKHQFVNTGLESMTFGHGRFACPGRFFASNESKLILAILLLNYDIKFEERTAKDGSKVTGVDLRPQNEYFADACFPDPSKKVMFRKRRPGADLSAQVIDHATGGTEKSNGSVRKQNGMAT